MEIPARQIVLFLSELCLRVILCRMPGEVKFDRLRQRYFYPLLQIRMYLIQLLLPR